MSRKTAKSLNVLGGTAEFQLAALPLASNSFQSPEASGCQLGLPAWINRRLALWLGYAPMLTPEKLRELRHPDWVCDNNAIQKVLDWQPQLQLEEGLKRTPGWCPLLQ